MSNPRKEYLALLRERQLKQIPQMCQNLREAAAGVGEILDFHGKALSDRVCDVLRDALAGLVMAELHIRGECERRKGGGQ
jgi:hypothetical protein